MENQTQNVKVNLGMIDVITSKAVISKRDGRIGNVVNIEGDFVNVVMERIGLRKFHYKDIFKGFKILPDNTALIETVIRRGIPEEALYFGMTDRECFCLAMDIADGLYLTFGVSNEEAYKVVRKLFNFVPEIEENK